MNKIKEYRKRRYVRLMARADAADDDKGSWITTENGHKVHLNEEGDPDKGNPHVIAAMNGDPTGSNSSGSSGSSSELRLKEKVKLLNKTRKGQSVTVSSTTGYPMTAQKTGDDEWEITFHNQNGTKAGTSSQKVTTEILAMLSELNSGDNNGPSQSSSGSGRSGSSEFKRPSEEEQTELLSESGYLGPSSYATYQDFVDLYGEEGAHDYLVRAAENHKHERPYDPDYDDPFPHPSYRMKGD